MRYSKYAIDSALALRANLGDPSSDTVIIVFNCTNVETARIDLFRIQHKLTSSASNLPLVAQIRLPPDADKLC